MRGCRVGWALPLAFAVVLSLAAEVRALPEPPSPPDLTAGGERDEKSADFNLGPTGARGWVWGWHEASYNSRQILVTQIAEDSPADGPLLDNDVILGIDGKPFTIERPSRTARDEPNAQDERALSKRIRRTPRTDRGRRRSAEGRQLEEVVTLPIRR